MGAGGEEEEVVVWGGCRFESPCIHLQRENLLHEAVEIRGSLQQLRLVGLCALGPVFFEQQFRVQQLGVMAVEHIGIAFVFHQNQPCAVGTMPHEAINSDQCVIKRIGGHGE